MVDVNLILVLAIPILALTIGLLAVYWDHRRKMAMIEKGIAPEEEEMPSSDNWWILAAGLILAAIGAGTTFESYARGGPPTGIAPLFIGLAVITYFLIRRRYTTETG